jgi:hypothetical protein
MVQGRLQVSPLDWIGRANTRVVDTAPRGRLQGMGAEIKRDTGQIAWLYARPFSSGCCGMRPYMFAAKWIARKVSCRRSGVSETLVNYRASWANCKHSFADAAVSRTNSAPRSASAMRL